MRRCSQPAPHTPLLRLSVQVIYSGGVDIDVLPVRADKGNAIRFMAERVRDPSDPALFAKGLTRPHQPRRVGRSSADVRGENVGRWNESGARGIGLLLLTVLQLRCR